MTTASPTTDDEHVEFTTAAEFFDGKDERADRREPRPAKGVVWYDQATPIFCCCRCHEHVAPLRFEGDRFNVEDYDERRAEAYRRLMDDGVTCDVCTGDLPAKVGR